MEGIRRDEFPLLNSIKYFLTCAISPLAKTVKAALNHFTDEWDTYGGLALGMPNGWAYQIERAREEFANFINAKKENVAYSFGVSVSSVSILTSFNLDKKNEFIFTDLDFPSVPNNIMAMKDHGADYRIAKSRDGEIYSEDFVKHYNEKTALLSVSEVMANNGFRINVNEFIEDAHRNDIPVFLDTYQSSGYIPMDVRKNNVDFLATGAQKYMLGGFGISFMYIREDWIEKLNPAAVGWFGVEDPFIGLFNGLPDTLDRPKDVRKFHLGGPYVVGAITAISGMQMINDIGLNKIYNHNMDITQLIIDKAKNKGFDVQTPDEKDKRGSIVNIKLDNAQAIVEKLRKENFALDYRIGGIRVAPHFYNNSDDVENLIERISHLSNEL